MTESGADILKISSAISFGAAIACALLVGNRIMRSTKLVGSGGGTSMRRAEMRDLALRNSPLFRVVLPWLRIISGITVRLDLESLRAYVRVPYERAGYPGGLDDDEVLSMGILIGFGAMVFIGISCFILFGPVMVWCGILGLPLGFLILVSALKNRADVREVRMLQALPYMLDLLVLMLRSGTSLPLALARVIEDYHDHPLGVELGQVLAEVDVGSTRAEAFRKFANRLKIPDITSLADSITQSEELGWPLAETLERLADRLSSERMLRAQSKAGAAGVLIMLPSTLVLAASVIILFGPIIVRLMRSGLGLG